MEARVGGGQGCVGQPAQAVERRRVAIGRVAGGAELGLRCQRGPLFVAHCDPAGDRDAGEVAGRVEQSPGAVIGRILFCPSLRRRGSVYSDVKWIEPATTGPWTESVLQHCIAEKHRQPKPIHFLRQRQQVISTSTGNSSFQISFHPP